ncbi:MAG: hypothetical protein MUF18_11590 [Fimbriiglobus sp.]|nr:hypothetical protein [Fimbriiglobus sp.]
MWLRVFAPTTVEVPPSAIVERLAAAGNPVVPHFKGDDLGWTTGELHLPKGGTPLLLARYLTKEDDLRDDLNAYAAELETMTYSSHAAPLMETVIQTQQMMTIRKPVDYPDEVVVDEACETLVRFLALAVGGVYQIDGRGWYAPDGTRLVEEY